MLIPTFQFHKGTIRTLSGLIPMSLLRYFNSIKVRLERNNQGNINVDFNYFNSIKVRLEPIRTKI